MAVQTATPAGEPSSSTRSRTWLATLSVVFLWGVAAWGYQLAHGLAATGMRDVVSWGMYIFTFAFFVGLSAGGLIMASSAEVFGVEALRPLSKLGVLTAAACVAIAAIMIVPDLGRPFRLLNIVLHPNWTSPLVWDIVIISIYFLFSVVDLWVMTRRGTRPSSRAKALRVLAYVGLPTAVLLHSITAWIFGLQIARSWWNTALMAPLFVVSAILSGTALIALIALAATRFDKVVVPERTWRLLAGLLAVGIAVDLFFVASDYITILWGNVPRERAALNLILPGGSWQWLFWLEWVAGGIVPFLLLVMPSTKRRLGMMGLASALILVGVYAFRIELVVGGMLRPMLDFPPGNALGTYTPGRSVFQFGGVYHPTWVEYSIVAGLIALFALIVTVGYRKLRVMESADEGPRPGMPEDV